MSAAAMANWAAGSSGVGPGVNKRVLQIMALSSISDGACGGSRSLFHPKPDRFFSTSERLHFPTATHQSQNTQHCGLCGFYFCGNLPKRHFGPPIYILPEGENENSPGRGPRHTVFVCWGGGRGPRHTVFVCWGGG